VQLIGLVVFLLMLRSSMITGWLEPLRHPRKLVAIFQGRRPSLGDQDFIMQEEPKHMSLQKPLESDIPLSPKSVSHVQAAGTSTGRPSEDKWHEVELGHEKEGPEHEEETVV